jgi:acetolactate synthase-1/2/3 large subunit
MSSENLQSTAYHFIEGLAEAGIEYLFSNFGTDHVALIEAMALLKRQRKTQPVNILCPHENVAIHMAAGYAAVTGRGQGVLVHVDAGTANAAMGVHNMFRSRWPVLLMAGRAPFSLHDELKGSRDNYVHYVQDPFDIASLVRPFVKWEYSLPSGLVAKEVLRRAHSVMHSDPPGPVYLTLPRETLSQEFDASQMQSFSADRYGAVTQGGIAPEQARSIAQALMKAAHPMIVTSYLGRKHEAVVALEALAWECGIRVYEFMPMTMNISRNSPCFDGFDPAKGLAKADLALLLDIDVPWLPKFTQPKPETRFIHIDVDPIKKDFPVWGFPTDVRVQADCAQALMQILQVVRAEADEAFKRRVAARMVRWPKAREERLQAAANAASMFGGSNALTPAYVCASINSVLNQEDIVVNEAIRNASSVLGQIQRTQPGTLFGCAGGGLGFSGGMALGAKLAKPNVRVVQFVGDGGFHFSTPTSVYAVAQRYKLPILTVVLDNGGWQAVKEAVLRVYPDGEAKLANDYQARLGGEQRHFQQVAQAFGAHGEYVAEPAHLPSAITRCMQALNEGRAAVLNVKVTPL